jgi:hypothetical protein
MADSARVDGDRATAALAATRPSRCCSRAIAAVSASSCRKHNTGGSRWQIRFPQGETSQPVPIAAATAAATPSPILIPAGAEAWSVYARSSCCGSLGRRGSSRGHSGNAGSAGGRSRLNQHHSKSRPSSHPSRRRAPSNGRAPFRAVYGAHRSGGEIRLLPGRFEMQGL